MQRVVLLCVGSVKTPWISQGCEHFLQRMRQDASVEVVEIPASKATSPDKQQAEESQRLLLALSKRQGIVWVLDERGKGISSQKFSDELRSLRDAGETAIIVLGGAFGLTDSVRARANKIVRLSEMTLPHELCRALLFEQLYRALQIAKGSGYHHA